MIIITMIIITMIKITIPVNDIGCKYANALDLNGNWKYIKCMNSVHIEKEFLLVILVLALVLVLVSVLV